MYPESPVPPSRWKKIDVPTRKLFMLDSNVLTLSVSASIVCNNKLYFF
jgi:hypothetical protein